jgi:surfeit locus 1 family protein
VFGAILPVLLALGMWQLDRAAYKERVSREQSERADRGPIEVDLVELDVERDRYQPALARGRFFAGRQWLLDNQIGPGRQVGYHVHTLLVLEGGQRGILVNRGWVPVGPSRQVLPSVQVADEPRTVAGRLAPPRRVGLRLDESGGQPPPGALSVLQEVLPAEVQAETGIEVEPLILELEPSAPDGFVREWTKPMEMGPEMHRGYAFQWFALAVALVVIYLAVNTRRTDREERNNDRTG